MKTSAYNYIVDRLGQKYWFNGITQRYFAVSSELSAKLEGFLKDAEQISALQKKGSSFFKTLKDNGFIIDDEVCELDIIRHRYDEEVESKNYFLIILPTLNCNYACWYCVQNHIESKMSDATIDSVKQHIKYMVEEEKITSLHIEWFGGEPFMFFDEVIKPITKYAIELCESNSIPFLNTATSNAYYLNDEVVKQLDELKLKNFQITLDGPRDQHNNVKFMDGNVSAFDTALMHINSILSYTKDISIMLRINYTDDNLDTEIVSQVNELIVEDNRNRVTIMMRKVWQECVDMTRTDRIDGVVNAFRNSGYVIDFKEISVAIPCYSEKKYYNSINYDGSVVKCTASDDLYKNAPGKLNPDGTITWKEGFIEKYHQKRFENDNCLNCRYLPLCMGNCALNYNPDNFVCKQQTKDHTFEQQIVLQIDFFENHA